MKKFKKHSAKMNITHYGVLVRRQFRQIYSNAKLFTSLLLQAPVMLFIALIVYNEDTFKDGYVSLFDASTIIFVLVFVSALMGILNSYNAICNERPILTREVFGGLDVTGYVLAKFTVLALVGLAQCVILSAGALLAIDFPFTYPFVGVLQFFLALYLTNVSVAAMGLLISSVLKNAGSAILPVLVIIIMQVVFSEAVFPIEGVVRNLCYITSTMWGVSLIGQSCLLNDYWVTYTGEIYKEIYDYSPVVSIAVLLALAALCLFLAIVKLKRDYKNKD
ncbi:MAG: hypothetical protein DBX59_02760 [Bacillota bacterium]|nr:MAG: hypothetical protein DBX59_02760 [Bacillota bacterium]